MVKIRLRRMGKKKHPTYRLIVADAHAPRDGKFIEIVGNYAPTRQPKVISIDVPRVLYWLSVGAQPSDPVNYLLDKVGVIRPNQYVEDALLRARIEPVDGTNLWFGELPGVDGVYATGETEQVCRRKLGIVLRGYIQVHLQHGLPLPDVLKMRVVRENMGEPESYSTVASGT